MITAIQSMICAKGNRDQFKRPVADEKENGMAIICVTCFILPDHAAAMTTPSLAATDRRPVMANSLARITMTIHPGTTPV